ncbi:MAG: hypothetical protein ACWA5K_05400, partial [bacterium]
MVDGLANVFEYDSCFGNWKQAEKSGGIVAIQSELVALAEAAEKAGIDNIARACRLLTTAYSHIRKAGLAPSDDLIDQLTEGHEALIGMIDRVAAHQDVPAVDDSVAAALAAIAGLAPQPEA